MSTPQLSKNPALQGRIRWLFIFSVVALVSFGGILYQQQKNEAKTRYWVNHSYTMIKKIGEIKTMVAQAESATRSRIISGDTSWNKEIINRHDLIQQRIAAISKDSPATEAISLAQLERLKTMLQDKKLFQLSVIGGVADKEVVADRMQYAGNGPLQSRQINTLLDSMYSSCEKDLLLRLKENEAVFISGKNTSLIAGLVAFLIVLALIFQLSRDMRLRQKAEAEVNSSDARYKNIIENASVVMYTTDVNGTITFANRQVGELTGYSVEELLGKDFSFLVHPSWLQQVFNHYTNQFQQRIPSTVLEFITRTKNGQQKWVEQTAQLLFKDDLITGYQCMVKDITEKKKIELELKESEIRRKENQYRLEAILENTTSLIFIKNLDGRYVMVNKRFKEVLGLTDEMVLNKTDYDFSEKEAADQYKRADDEVISTRKPVESEEWIYGPDGRKNLLVIKFPLIDHKKKIFGVSGIATDITDRVLYQQKLIEARRNAEEAKLMQEQFLANMSHEIRTPMNGIQGMTNLLQQTELNDQQKEFTGMIKRSVNSLLVIVNDILDYSKIKAGRLTIDKINFNLREVIQGVRAQFEHEIARKELGLEIDIDPKIPAVLIGDPYRLNQILVNIVGNAVKFTVAGHVEVRASLEKQTDQFAHILFQVTDTGLGIPDEKMETIFDAFTQAGPDIARNYGGAGLGLAISKGLIDLQHGTISVKSKQGEGSVFSFELPYEAEPENKETETPTGSRLLKGKRFLVVEDNEVNQKLVNYVLKKVGALVDIAGNGRIAIEMVEKNKEGYDLIIMDIQMPVMDGYETTEYLRKVLHLRTPIIAMTATALKGDQEKSVEVGMNDFMLKPFDFDDLYKRLIRLLTTKDANSSNEAANMEVKLYDLGLLEGLDDKDSLLDVLDLFLENTPSEVREMPILVAEQQWNALYKLAHKLKGALAMLQANQLADLLGAIEANAKEEKELDRIAEDVEKLTKLFAVMESQLLKEKATISGNS